MTFKIGDKVRLTGEAWYDQDDSDDSSATKGNIVEIVGLCSGGRPFFRDVRYGSKWYVASRYDAQYERWGAELVTDEEDLINDPSHYRQGGIAVHEVLDAYGLDRKHYLASATEYILRSGFKGTEESDLRKAVWHLNHYIEQHFGGAE